jgi:hypothetical protein
MIYKVKVRRVGALFGRTYRCVADGIVEEAGVRWLFLEDDRRLEFSMHRYRFEFDAKRNQIIKEKARQN